MHTRWRQEARIPSWRDRGTRNRSPWNASYPIDRFQRHRGRRRAFCSWRGKIPTLTIFLSELSNVFLAAKKYNTDFRTSILYSALDSIQIWVSSNSVLDSGQTIVRCAATIWTKGEAGPEIWHHTPANRAVKPRVRKRGLEVWEAVEGEHTAARGS